MRSRLLQVALVLAVFTSRGAGRDFDLRGLEAGIQAAVTKAMPAVVACSIKGQPGSFSAVVVSEDGLVLTAAHCVARRGPQVRIRPGSPRPGTPPRGKPPAEDKPDPKEKQSNPKKAETKKKPETIYVLKFADGRSAEAVALGYNQQLDCAMMRITKKGKYPFAELGDSSQTVVNQPCLAISHPGSGSKGRGPVVRFGRIKQPVTVRAGMLQSTCLIEPGDSGGPLFDMDGRVIGINSQIDMAFHRNFQVAVNTFKQYWDRMQKKGAFRHTGTPGIPEHGIKWKSSRYDGLSVVSLKKDSPGAKSGLKKGDRVAKVAGLRVMSAPQFEKQYIKLYQAGKEDVALTLRVGKEGDETKDITMKLPPLPEPTGVAIPELEQLPSHVGQLEDKLDDSIVLISSLRDGKYMAVHGTIVGDNGLIVSKSSQVGDKEVVIKLPDGNRPPAMVLARDEKNDLVLMQCETLSGYTAMEMAAEPGNRPEYGTMLLTPNPRGEAYLSVVGTKVFASAATAGNSQSYLGIAMVDKKGKPTITAVNRNSEAGQAGLRTGDVIVSLNGQKMTKVSEVSGFLKKLKPGSQFFMELRRNGAAIAKRVRVGSRPEMRRHAADYLVGGKSQRRDGFSAVFTHDATFQQKEVGTPVYDLSGRFIAFNIARHSRAQCYAIPAKVVAEFVGKNTK